MKRTKKVTREALIYKIDEMHLLESYSETYKDSLACTIPEFIGHLVLLGLEEHKAQQRRAKAAMLDATKVLGQSTPLSYNDQTAKIIPFRKTAV